jgi:hypothetical protein
MTGVCGANVNTQPGGDAQTLSSKEMARSWAAENEVKSEDVEDKAGDHEGLEEGTEETGGFWCARSRELTAIERRVLKRRALWIRARAVAALLAFPLVLCFAGGAGVFVEEAEGIARAVAIILTFLLFAGSVVLFIGSWLLWQEGGTTADDARWGSVRRFLVVTAGLSESCKLFEPAFRTGLLQRDSPETQTVETLLGSHWVWQVNGVRPEYWRRMFPNGQ